MELPQRPAQRAAPHRHPRWRRASVVLAMLGVYTNLSVQLGPFRVYGVVALVCGGVLLVANRPRTSLKVSLVVPGAIGFTIVVLAGRELGALLVTGQILLVLIALSGIALELRSWDDEVLCRWARWSVIMVCILAIAETRMESVRALSDSFRTAVYGRSDLFVYSGDARDELLHGVVRPKVFTQEPSHPAKFVGAMIAVWCLTLRSPQRRLVILAGSLAVALYATRSPSVILCAPVVIYSVFRDAVSTVRPLRKVSVAAISVVAVVAVVTAPKWVGLVPSSRTAAIAAEEDPSSLFRLNVPWEATRLVLERNPVFGLGMSSAAQEAAAREAARPFSLIAPGTADRFAPVTWGNGFLHVWAHMGIVGAAAFFWWLGWYLRRHLGVRDLGGAALAFVVVFVLDGTYPLLRPWLYFVLLAVALERSAVARGLLDRSSPVRTRAPRPRPVRLQPVFPVQSMPAEVTPQP